MPRTEATPFLEILLDGAQNSFQPGDTISGRIVRIAPIVSSRAWLTVQLHGRSKSKITVQTSQSPPRIYRGRFNFFESTKNQKQLFDGHIRIPPQGMQEWPFSLTIPLGCDPTTIAAGNKQKFSYLPLSSEDVACHPLPPVFYAFWTEFTSAYECFVEYFLTAELHVESATGQATMDKAALPINVLPHSTPDMMSEFNLIRRSFLCRLSTYHLRPGMQSASLSFPQHTQEFFGLPTVPQFAFSLHVHHPTIMQVGNPNPIPFRLLIIPDRDRTTESIGENPQTVTLAAMIFEIKASTKLICPGTLFSHTSDQNRKFGFDLKSTIEQRGAAIVLPSGEKAEALDVGELLQLCIAKAAPLDNPSLSRQQGQLYPSFTTYNIKHSHRLKWKLKLTAAGKSTEVSNEMDITLVPGRLSELPPYEEYQESESPQTHLKKE